MWTSNVDLMFKCYVEVLLNGNSGSSRRIAYIGLPQGSVLSPPLYNIYVHCMKICFESNDQIETIQFANNTTLFIWGKDINLLMQDLQKSLLSYLNGTVIKDYIYW